jgi:formylmethanofuran dehydrogenase subunit E
MDASRLPDPTPEPREPKRSRETFPDVCWRCGEEFDGRLAQTRSGFNVCPRCAGEMQSR